MAFRAPAFALKKSAQGVLVFSPSGALLAQVTSNVVVWDVRQRTVVAQFKAIANEQHLAFAPDDARLAIRNTDGGIVVCDPRSGAVRCATAPCREDRSGCRPQFSFDGRYLLDGDHQGRLTVRDAADLRTESVVSFRDGMIGDIAASAEAATYAVAANARATLRGGGRLLMLGAAIDFATMRSIEPPPALREAGGWRAIRALAFSPDGGQLAIVADRCGDAPPVLGVIAVADGTPGWCVPMRDTLAHVWSLSWSVDGLIALVVHEPTPPGLAFDAWQRHVQAHDLEFVHIHRASDGALLLRQPFDGVRNAQFRPASAGLAVTSANVRGCYVEDVARLPAVSRANGATAGA